MTRRRRSSPARRWRQLAATVAFGVGGLVAGAYGLGRLGLAVVALAGKALGVR